MAKIYKKDWKKITALGIGGLTVLISICGGLLVANFTQIEPVLAANLIVGTIAGTGISIISAFQIVNTYKSKPQIKKLTQVKVEKKVLKKAYAKNK